MSKDLEKEYQKLMTEDLPDLWDRIDAGLEPKQPAVKKISLWRTYRTWGTVAAAVLCLAVIGPVLFMQITGRNPGSGPQSYSSAPSEGDMADLHEQNPQNVTGYEEAAGGAVNGGAQVEALPAEGYISHEEAFEGDFVWDGDMHEEALNADSATENSAIVTVRAVVEEMLEKEGRTVYLVRIEDAGDSGFSERSILRLYGESGFTEEPVVGESYFFDFAVSIIGYGTAEYIVMDVRQE